MKTTITTTQRPTREIEVEEHELEDLRRQGLIHRIVSGDKASPKVAGAKKPKAEAKAKKTEEAPAAPEVTDSEAGLKPAKEEGSAE